MNIAVLEADLHKVRDQGLALYKSALVASEAENRPFTDDEHAAITAKKTEGLAIEAKIARVRGDHAMLAEIERLTAGAAPAGAAAPTPARRLSWGQVYTQSEAHAFIKGGGHRTSAQWRSPSIELPWQRGHGGVPSLMAATLTEGAGSGAAWVTPDYLPGVVMPVPPPFLVSELFAQGSTDSNLISYMRETAYTNAAAPVLEGGLKPESTLTFEQAQDPVRKIAHWLPVTEELLEDAPAVSAYIDARLRHGVLAAEQNQILNGDGIAPNLAGILTRPGLAPSVVRDVPPSTPTQPNHDALLEQALAIYASSGLMPDGFVLNPLNWSSILMAKTATGEYFAGGPFSPIQTPTLWGLRVALSPAIAAGTALVGAFQTGAQIFRKGGVRVEASNSHADYFIKNLVAIRAEERLALAVYRPGAFGTVTGLL